MCRATVTRYGRSVVVDIADIPASGTASRVVVVLHSGWGHLLAGRALGDASCARAAIIAPMSDATPEDHAQPTPSSALQPPGGPRWLAPAALLVAVIAVGLSIWALVSAPSSDSAGGKLAGDPKMRVCTAFDTVSKAVSGQTHNDLGPSPVAQAAVAGNARLALVGGGQYLLSLVDSATPSQVADPVRSFAHDLQDIGMYALAGVPNTDAQQAARLTQADLVRKQIIDACK